jgi:uncharacterized membrane protein
MKAASSMKLGGLIAALALLGLPMIVAAMVPASEKELVKVTGLYGGNDCDSGKGGSCYAGPNGCGTPPFCQSNAKSIIAGPFTSDALKKSTTGGTACLKGGGWCIQYYPGHCTLIFCSGCIGNGPAPWDDWACSGTWEDTPVTDGFVFSCGTRNPVTGWCE